MIDKVYVLNLDRQSHRWYTMMATLHMVIVPFERIERVPAKDGGCYENRGRVLDDMVCDGFDAYVRFWRELPADSETTFWHESKNLCVQWGHLDHSENSGKETALVCEDDTYLAIIHFMRFRHIARCSMEVLFCTAMILLMRSIVSAARTDPYLHRRSFRQLSPKFLRIATGKPDSGHFSLPTR